MDELTPAGKVIAREIAASGPMHFSRFMETALYHPEHGYYRRPRDPFGKSGDFYTAEQLQPVFGRLIAASIRQLGETHVLELGAGRREMHDAFVEFSYTPVDVDYGDMPECFKGVVFSNEFFDAIPVDVMTAHGERLVDFRDGRFVWTKDPVQVRELQTYRLAWLEQIAGRLERGYVLTIDYGYTHRELVRFPEGTLMSYYRHQAVDDVLAQPGEQDITAHVDFTALQERGAQLGLETVRFESMASFLLRAGEQDAFASALAADSEDAQFRLRMQLKSLLFGMGETFRVLLQRK